MGTVWVAGVGGPEVAATGDFNTRPPFGWPLTLPFPSRACVPPESLELDGGEFDCECLGRLDGVRVGGPTPSCVCACNMGGGGGTPAAGCGA